MYDILRPTARKRLIFFLAIDAVIFFFSLYLSLLLRFNLNINLAHKYLQLLPYWTIFIIVLKVGLLYIFKLYFVSWRFVSVEEFFKIVVALFFAAFIAESVDGVLYLAGSSYIFPRSALLMDFFISLVFVSSVRISKRLFLEIINKKNNTYDKKALIIGAGFTAERIARELLRDSSSGMFPIAFLDDDVIKQNTYIHNIKVVGGLNDMEKAILNYAPDIIIIAIPSLSHLKIREIYEISKKHGITDVKVVPSINKMPANSVTIKDLRDINLEDLLARNPVQVETDIVFEFLKNKVVFISGAAGSIGSEILRQLIKFKPLKIIAYEIDETEIHDLSLKLNRLKEKLDGDTHIEYIVGDVRDSAKLRAIFEYNNINVVFHAAAYKHVPLMEFFPEEAVKTNILGTHNLAKLSVEYKVEKFVNISTDKAVNPTSIMGATKRFAEMICRAFNSYGETRFISVRFGNVLGSRGSVIPIFLEQIKNGGPVTVTHPEMKRYFMTIPEAVLLVFQAAAMGNGGEVFVLDMGEPVKIVNLAEELIRLNGLEPYKDIAIVFTGLRPGEKLFEELLTAEEGTYKTKHSKIYVARNLSSLNIKDIESYINDFENLAEYGKGNIIKEKLKTIVPFFKQQ